MRMNLRSERPDLPQRIQGNRTKLAGCYGRQRRWRRAPHMLRSFAPHAVKLSHIFSGIPTISAESVLATHISSSSHHWAGRTVFVQTRSKASLRCVQLSLATTPRAHQNANVYNTQNLSTLSLVMHAYCICCNKLAKWLSVRGWQGWNFP